MNSRERLLATYNHRQPDRCATYLWINDAAMAQLIDYLGVESRSEVADELNIDEEAGVGVPSEIPPDKLRLIQEMVPDRYKGRDDLHVHPDGRVVRTHEGSDYLEDTVWAPLQEAESVEDIDAYPLPRPEWLEIPEDLPERIQQLKDDGYIVRGGVSQVFKSCWMFRGMDNVLMDFLVNPEIITHMYDVLYRFNTAKASALAEAGVDLIQIVGDLGMQDSLMMSPDTWRSYARPRLDRMISTLKDINPELKIYMHTDGDVSSILDDLVEVGVDILNPIQPECMSPEEIKRTHGDQLVLHGCMSLQHTLPHGTPDEVRREARRLIDHCNQGGGFVLGPSNVLFKEIPPENIVAMYSEHL